MKKWIHWFKGLCAAIIGGAASAVSGYMGNVLVNPDALAKMDIGERFTMFGIIALFAGFFSGVLYLKQSPLPCDDGSQPCAPKGASS